MYNHSYLCTLNKLTLQLPFFKAILTPLILKSENDYCMIEQFQNNPNLPVCISVYEQYKLIETIIKEIKKMITEVKVYLVQMTFPSAIKLPNSLLEEDIIISADVDFMLHDLLEKNISCFSIKNSLIRNRNESGNNELKIDLYSNSQNINYFNHLINILSSYGFEKKLNKKSLYCVDRDN